MGKRILHYAILAALLVGVPLACCLLGEYASEGASRLAGKDNSRHCNKGNRTTNRNINSTKISNRFYKWVWENWIIYSFA